jgi:hypothetical protein
MTHPGGLSPSLAVVALAIVLAGCGGEAGGVRAPAEPSSTPDPRAEPHIADALAELDRAEREVDRIVGPGGAQAMLEREKGEGEREGEDKPDDDEAAATACETACRALGAMERSAAHLCQLAGDRDDRCQAAQSRVQRAGERVRATCGGCYAA